MRDPGSWPDGFSTPRLRAERLRPSHCDELCRMHQDPRVMAQLGGVQPEARTRRYLDKNLAHWDTYGHGLWIVYERDGDAPIGRALLRHLLIDAVDDMETGYAFYEPYWGRGLATELTVALLDLGFSALGVSSLVAVTTPGNLSSQHVLAKTGFVLDRPFTREGEPLLLFRVTSERWASSPGRDQ